MSDTWASLNKQAGAKGPTQSASDWGTLNANAKSTYQPYVAPEVPPSSLQKITAGIKNYADASERTTSSFIEGIKHPIKAFNAVVRGFTDANKAGVDKAGKGLYDVVATPGVAKKVAGFADLITGTVEAAFAPVTGLFNVADHVPGLKQVADTINVPFTAVGMAGGFATGKIVDLLPISKESKDILHQPISEVGSLAGQLLLGGKIMERVGEFSKKGKEITPEVAKKIVEEAKTEINTDPETPNKYAEYNKKIEEQNRQYFEDNPNPENKGGQYEPYTPNDQLPTIQMGAKPKSVLETIQLNEKQGSGPKDLTYEPIVDRISGASPSKPILDTINESRLAPPPETVRPEGVAKAANDISNTLVQRGLDAIPPEEQAKFTTGSYKDSVAKTAHLLDQAPDSAKAMAKGEIPVPEGVHPQIVFNAVEALATKNGDVQLLRDLAKSPLATQLSEAGSTLGSHGFNDNPNSPVSLIKSVEKARENTASKKVGDVSKAKKEVVKDIKTEIEKNAPTKEVWKDFISSISCGY